jgi:hypothetical protein
MVGFNWPVAAQKPQVTSACTGSAGLILPLWMNHSAYSFDGSNFTSLTMPPGAGDNPTSYSVSRTGDGYNGCVADGIDGAWLMASTNFLAYLPLPNTQDGFVVDLTGSGGVPTETGVLSTVSESAGLLYFTVTPTSGLSPTMGVSLGNSSATAADLLDESAGGTQTGVTYFSDGSIRSGGVLLGTADAWLSGATVQVAVAAALGQVWFRVGTGDWNGNPLANPATFVGGFTVAIFLDTSLNGYWIRHNNGDWNNDPSADPVTGVGGVSISAILSNIIYVTGIVDSSTTTHNFGASAFSGTVPSGYSAGIPAAGGGFTSFDPATLSGATLSNGNHTLTSGASIGGATTLDGYASGSYFYEYSFDHGTFFTNDTGGGPARHGASLSFLAHGEYGSGDNNGGIVSSTLSSGNTSIWAFGTDVLPNMFTANNGDIFGVAYRLSKTIPFFAFVGGYTEESATSMNVNFGASLFSPVAPSGYGAFNAAATLDPATLSGAGALSGGNLILDIPATTAPTTVTVNTGITATGMAASGNTAIAVDSNGVIFVTSSRHPGIVEAIEPGFAALSRDLTANQVDLYTTLPLSSSLGIMSLAGRSFSTLLTPIPYPTIVRAAATGTAVAVAGWSLAFVASGAAQLASSPADPTGFAAFTSPAASGVVLLEGSDPVWTINNVASGQAGCSYLAWNPDGTQVLDSCSASVNVLQIIGGQLQQVQSLALSQPGRLGITPDGTNALVCQTAANQIAVLVNTLDTWTIGTPTAIPSPTAAVFTTSTAGYAAANGDLYSLSRAGNVWSATLMFSLGFTASNMALDPLGNLYIVGTGTGTGNLTLVQNNVATSTMSWVGSGDDLTVLQGQIAVLDITGGPGVFILGVPGHDTLGENVIGMSSGSRMRMYGLVGSTLVDESTNITAGGPIFPATVTALAATPNSVWLCAANEIALCNWERPYQIRNRQSGEFALWNGSEWGQYHMGILHDPSAMTWDASGNIEVATQENDIYTFGGTVTGTGVPYITSEVLPVYPGQVTGISLGLSSLSWLNGHLYAGTGFSGVLVQVS